MDSASFLADLENMRPLPTLGDVGGLEPLGLAIGTVEFWTCTGSGRNYKWHVRKPERAKKLVKPQWPPQPAWFNPS
jgi:hypothetical protein